MDQELSGPAMEYAPSYWEGLQVAAEAKEAEDKFPKHNRTYYFNDDPMATFLIEMQLFKVHRYFLMEGSEIFRNMFTSPPGEGTAPDGMSDERPIHLPDVTTEEFEALLNHFYLDHRNCSAGLARSPQAHLDLLSISHKFLFDEVFKLCVQRLRPLIDQIPVIERIRLGEKYDLSEWLFSAYEEIVDRTQPLSVDEAEVLGSHRIVRLLQAREDAYKDRLEATNTELQRERGRNRGVVASVSVPPITRSSKVLVAKYFSDMM